LRLNTNRWNRLRYTFWAPFYDLVGWGFDGRRRESLRLLDPRPGERILVVGCGTGADLRYLPDGCLVLATDLTPAMLQRARPRARPGHLLAVMDGQQLGVQAASVDAVVLHLILAVVPDPARCLQEAARTLRPGGRMVVFDKFVAQSRAPLLLRLANIVTNALFTDVTRNFQEILDRSEAPLVIDYEAPALLKGLFRHLRLRRRRA
jgi:phosphatidylethanolamine/phosphatidyl-N-methylethanolamine N-methyltransferase